MLINSRLKISAWWEKPLHGEGWQTADLCRDLLFWVSLMMELMGVSAELICTLASAGVWEVVLANFSGRNPTYLSPL